MLCSHFTARVLAVALLATSAVAAPWGCGAHTGLDVADALPSNAFCGRASYASGFAGLSIYVLLDQSGSMAVDGKWDSVTAAIASFVDDPLASGIGMGMQFFPLGTSCSDTDYATPAAPIQLLPSNAAVIKASLAAHGPDGNTPTVPALRGALEYARASMIADPTREVLVVLATDGDPDDCFSDVQGVAAVAAQGLSGKPQVLTAVIGIENADTKALAVMAAAGGAGAPIPIGTGTGAAQQFVDALLKIRETAAGCRYAVPPTPGAAPADTDVAVSYVSAPGVAPRPLALVAGLPGCSAEGGFYVDDPKLPAAVVLCPGTCQIAHAAPGSTVAVSAGCGQGSPPPGTPPPDGGGTCGGSVDFACVSACGSTLPAVVPVCLGGEWGCAPGLVSTKLCTECQPVPHGCCKPDGTLAEGSCINGAWQCPPGAQLFGTGTCKPPVVCAATLPCALSAYCKSPDAACGQGTFAGGTASRSPRAARAAGRPCAGATGRSTRARARRRSPGPTCRPAARARAPGGRSRAGRCSAGSQTRCAARSRPCRRRIRASPSRPAARMGATATCARRAPPGKCADLCTTDPGTGGPVLTCEII